MAKNKKVSLLTIPKGFDLCKRGISQTQANNFMSCRKKWLLYINGYTAPSDGGATSFGSVFHYLLEQFYNTHDLNTSPDVWLAKCRKELHAQGAEPQSIETVVGMAAVVYRAYACAYADDLTKRKFLMVERDMTVRSVNRGGAARRIKIDLVYEDLDGSLWIMDHKTRGRIDVEALQYVLSMDFQLLHCVTTLEDMLGREVKGAVYNVIRSPQLKRGKEETLQDFCERIRLDIETRPEWYFLRMPVSFTKKDKATFTAGTWLPVAADMQACCKDVSKCYRNTEACTGKYKCDYLKACSKDDLSVLVKEKR